MLVLTREACTSIIVGTEEKKVTFRILSIKGKYVKIGIDAPREIPVHREEVYEKILANNKEKLDKAILRGHDSDDEES